MTVADLLEILSDPDLPGDTPVRVEFGMRESADTPWEWQPEGAHATMAGPDRELVLELAAVPLAEHQ